MTHSDAGYGDIKDGDMRDGDNKDGDMRDRDIKDNRQSRHQNLFRTHVLPHVCHDVCHTRHLVCHVCHVCVGRDTRLRTQMQRACVWCVFVCRLCVVVLECGN